jgi:hypothetical protein
MPPTEHTNILAMEIFKNLSQDLNPGNNLWRLDAAKAKHQTPGIGWCYAEPFDRRDNHSSFQCC